MKSLRKLHLYLGCFFTPILLFFVVTAGCSYSTFTSRAKTAATPRPGGSVCSLMSTSTSAGSTPRPRRLSAFRRRRGDRLFALQPDRDHHRPADEQTKSVVWLCLLGGALLPVLLLMFS